MPGARPVSIGCMMRRRTRWFCPSWNTRACTWFSVLVQSGALRPSAGRGTAATCRIDPHATRIPLAVTGLHQCPDRACLLQLDAEGQSGLRQQRLVVEHLDDGVEVGDDQHALHIGQVELDRDRHVHRILRHLGRQHLDARIEGDRRIAGIFALQVRPARRAERVGVCSRGREPAQPSPKAINQLLHRDHLLQSFIV
jgi:hypothetical protein